MDQISVVKPNSDQLAEITKLANSGKLRTKVDPAAARTSAPSLGTKRDWPQSEKDRAVL